MKIIQLEQEKTLKTTTLVDKQFSKVTVNFVAQGDGNEIVSAPQQVYKNAKVKIVEKKYTSYADNELYINGKMIDGWLVKATAIDNELTTKVVTSTI